MKIGERVTVRHELSTIVDENDGHGGVRQPQGHLYVVGHGRIGIRGNADGYDECTDISDYIGQVGNVNYKEGINGLCRDKAGAENIKIAN